MLWLPWIRRIPPRWVRVLMAVTVGLLAWLAIDASLEGIEIAGEGAAAFGGAGLVVLGAFLAYGLLTYIGAWLRARSRDVSGVGGDGYLALLVAIGIGLHNLGEGLAIGSAYAVGALALGASLVIGFALHNTTEGLAIVAPLAARAPSLRRLVLLGLIAGAPAILGAWIGAAAFQPSVASLLLGFGVGAIVQVIVQLLPTLRDRERSGLSPAVIAGLVGGVVLMFATGLLV
jgi:zinc transporter ZupT